MTNLPIPTIDPARCDGCGLCIAACEAQALDLRDGRAVIARPDDCTYSARCEAACPTGAIELAYVVCFADTHGMGRNSLHQGQPAV